MRGHTEKFTAIALTAIMVLSALAMPVAAAPPDPNLTSTPDDSSVSEGETFTIEYELENQGDDAGGGGLSVETPDGVDVTDVEGDGAGSPTRFFIDAPDNGESRTVTYTFEVTDASTLGSSFAIDAEAELQNDDGTATDTTSDTFTVEDDDGEPEPPDEQPLDETTQLTDDGLFFIGQTLVTDAYDDDDDVTLERSDGTFVSEVTVEDGQVTLETENRDAGEYQLVSPSGPTIEFELAVQEYNVSPDTADVVNARTGTDADVTVNSNRDGYVHVVSSPDVTAATLAGILSPPDNLEASLQDTDGDGEDELVLTGGSTQDVVNADFTGINEGQYEINFRVFDTGVSDSITINVTDAEGTASFDKLITEERTGDIVTIPISLSNTETANVTVGSDDVNYEATVRITDGNSDGSVTLEWNTYLAKQDDVGAFSVAPTPQGEAADSVTVVDSSESFEKADSRVDATNYPLSATVAGDETDVARVALREASGVTVEVESRRARPTVDNEDIDLDNSNATGSVAKGDKLVLRHQVGGVFGYGVGEEGVSLTFVETNLEDNEEAETVSLDNFELRTIDDGEPTMERSENRILAIADTDNAAFEAGQDYQAVLEVDASENPYYDENVEVTETVSIVPRDVSVDTGGSDTIRVQAVSSATISGTTSVADGTPVTVTVRSTNPEVPLLRSQTTTAQDGTFSATFNLSDAQPGQELSVTVREGQGAFTSVDGVATQAANVDASAASITDSGEVISGISAFLPNAGFVTIHDSTLQDGAVLESVRGTSKYFGPGQVNDISIRLDDPYQGGTHTIIAMAHRDTDGDAVYDFVTSEGTTDGPYVLDGSAVTGSAEVEVSTPTPTTTTPTTTPPTTTPTTTPPTTTPTPTPTTTTSDGGGVPGFGVAVALVALLAAALLATRRREE
jgi:PGF-CTERM protein